MPHSDLHRGYRSLPYKRPFFLSMLFYALWLLSLIATVTLAVLFVRTQDRDLGIPLVACMLGSALLWAIAYPVRRSAKCPLCKGTPLLDNRAAKHARARRFFPLNYGTSALLSLFLTHRYRCMFCGNPFDLLKKPANMFGRNQEP
ncbi:hypothetical protein [Haloferula sargassicola]|uniref:Uncharacterized protein n=1 Tax=Haloferula sargassicola TaxID=490096 RepID=A0ABP9UTW0_9BACT